MNSNNILKNSTQMFSYFLLITFSSKNLISEITQNLPKTLTV